MLSILITIPATAVSETIYVKYEGSVDLSTYYCEYTASSFVNRLCFNEDNQTVIALLGSTYYQYCGIDLASFEAWLSSYSLGSFFNSNIKNLKVC